VLESTLRGWPLRQRIRLAAETTAPRKARDFLAAVCAGWNAGAFAEIGGLVLSELVSNAVRHAGGYVEVSLILADGRLTIEVRDGGEGVPAVVPVARRTIGGNGLDIVSRLADSWGVTPEPTGGKSVWVVLTADR
jgi:anti-sigma regulatory factor (Ser/Thr protein kinase)